MDSGVKRLLLGIELTLFAGVSELAIHPGGQAFAPGLEAVVMLIAITGLIVSSSGLISLGG